MRKLIVSFFVVFSLMSSLQAEDVNVICNQKIDPEQVIIRCAEIVVPTWSDPDQEDLVELFYEMVSVIIGNSTDIPKASDEMKGNAVLLGMCYNYQTIWDNLGVGALAFDCYMENPLAPGSNAQEIADCKYIEKITKCVVTKFEVLCPKKKAQGKRVRRSLDIMTASRSLATFAFA